MSACQVIRGVLIAVFAWLQLLCAAQSDTTRIMPNYQSGSIKSQSEYQSNARLLHPETQSDTTLLLPVVHVTSSKPQPEIIGERTEFWNDSSLSTLHGRSLGELISDETGAFVKTYGSGGIATISLRGGTAGQTTITWNGVPLQNPMLGLTDLSLIPMSFVDEAQISYGGNTAAEGSGSVSGVIALRNDAYTPNNIGVSINTALGSFGFWNQDAQLKYGNGKIGGRTKYFYQEADNDFTFQIRPDLPVNTQSHGKTKQSGILQELHYSIKSNQQLSAFIWWQKSDRQIPPTTVQNASEAAQEDESVRVLLNWKLQSKIWKWNAKAAVFKDRIKYSDPQILLEANSNSTVAMAEVESSWSIDPAYQFSFGLNHYAISALTDSYSERKTQQRTALYASYLQDFGNWSGQLNIRQELVDSKLAPFALALGINGKLTQWLDVKAKFSRDYRLPTTNDMYWVPGGNPDLLPEKGWSQEIGLAIKNQNPRHALTYGVTGFNRNISNWILWSIEAGETFWSVKNIAKVHSRGIEQRLNYKWQQRNWVIVTSLGYDYILSTNEIALDNPMIEEGEQLIYVPLHSGRGSIGMQWKGLNINYRHTFAGMVSTEYNDELDGYNLGNVSVQYDLSLSQFGIAPFFEINNIWDADYRVLQYRPTPGRNFRLGVKLDFETNQ